LEKLWYNGFMTIQTLELAGWKHLSSGKVRELYIPVGEHPLGDVVLIVTTDRISAFDYILESVIPGKGEVLTKMTLFWLDKLREFTNHYITTDGVPAEVAGRAMICRRLEMVPVECVARGFLTGSAFAEYQKTGGYQEFDLPEGLVDGSRLDVPIFTPAMKSAVGEHDENVTFQYMASQVGAEVAEELRNTTIAIYQKASRIITQAGLTLVDTKLEFGYDLATRKLTLGDEILTPDSSRYWDEHHNSYDKQFVRRWLLEESGWDPASDEPPPPLPDEVVEQTVAVYKSALHRLEQV
jgi:phosphoribosylaminoimidazole-succinocarboxamide synthase